MVRVGADQGVETVAQGTRQILQPPDPVFVQVQFLAGIDQRLRAVQAQVVTCLEQGVFPAMVLFQRAGDL